MRGVVRDELERARPQQIADATEAAKSALESSFVDLGGLPQVRGVVALWGELVDTGLLDRLRAMSAAPHLSLDVLEQRSKLATQQAVAYALKETASLRDSTDRLLQHLPGFINAIASVPALANLIRQQRLEIDALKAADEAHVDFG